MEQGFLGPLRVLDEAQAAAYLAQYHEAFGKQGKATTHPNHRFNSHLFLPFVAALVSCETIVARVRELLGPDLLCWFTEWHVKPPASAGRYTWHQDSTYAGLDPPEDVVTVWVALTEATRENGCLEFLPLREYNGQQLAHVEEPGDPTNLLLKGQRIPDELLDVTQAVPVTLRPGEATIHAFRCVHASGPNRSPNLPRVGLAIRYMKPSVRQTKGSQREGAVLVSGEDRHGHFHLRSFPTVAWDERGLALHAQEMEAMQANYVNDKQTEEQENAK